MKHKPGTIEALAEIIANTTRGVKPARPQLRVIATPKPTHFDAITREACIRRIRFLSRAFRLHWLVEQATFNRYGLDALEDNELGDLLKEAERARECLQEGIPLEDAGFLRNVSTELPTRQGREG